MVRFEDKIRDYLAEHLDLLEVGFQLIQKEFRLPFSDGAGGRIDLLAKDKLGNYVVIEIKRSDQAARQTLNEVHKYTALFRVQHGLDEVAVRIMVVSTEWHELILPLSEFAKVSSYSVQGIKIRADQSGRVLECSPVALTTSETPDLPLVSRCQMAYLFDSEKSRSGFLSNFQNSLFRAGICDYFLLECNYRGTSPEGKYHFGLYLCFSSPLRTNDKSEIQVIKMRSDWDDGLDEPDENFLAAIKLTGRRTYSDAEIGYPEKLLQIAIEWDLVVTERVGIFDRSRSVFSDEELIKIAQATDGGSDLYFSRASSPRFKSSWSSLKSQTSEIFKGYPNWENIATCVLDEIGVTSLNATVSLAAYTPANLILSLYALSVLNSTNWFPQFTMVVDDPATDEVRIICGLIVWDGIKVEQPFSSIGEMLYGNLANWVMATHFNATVDSEPHALSLHRLQEVAIEWVFNRKTSRSSHLREVDKHLERIVGETSKFKSPIAFASQHKGFLQELVHAVDGCSVGLRDSMLAAHLGKI